MLSKGNNRFNNDVEALINMANTARREGILALEGSAEEVEDRF
jgi:flagellar motor component MotA